MDKYYKESYKDVEEQLNTDTSNGLSDKEAEERLKKHGKNEITVQKRISALEIFISQFKDIIMLLLFTAAAISFFMGDTVEAIAILVVVLLTAGFGFITEYNAEKSVEELQKMITPQAKVLRHGEVIKIEAENIVPGDVLVVEEGDRVTADGRLYEAENLYINEAMLTGESEPVSKNKKQINDDGKVVVADRINMVYTGTTVTRGNGKAIVTATGKDTEMGNISQMLQETNQEETPLEKQLDKTGKFLIEVTFAITIIVAIAGVLRGHPFIEMLKTAIALAIAAVPEGLPAVATITLAVGMKQMAKKKAILKSLPAVETLGSTTVICTDKTGTLTESQMTLKQIILPDRDIEVSGTGYKPEGSFSENDKKINVSEDDTLKGFLQAGSLASNASLVEEDGWKVVGDPTEGALKVAAFKAGIEEELMSDSFERIDEIPFDSDRKYMAVSVDHNGDELVYLKGAPKVVLDLCQKINVNDEIISLEKDKREKLLERNVEIANQGLRVLAIAYKDRQSKQLSEDIESDLIFLGFAGILDPPREDVLESIKEAQKAGIKIIMITGDQKETAKAIAQKVGIEGADEEVLTGVEIDDLSQSELLEKLKNVSIFARVSPKNKLEIVKALNKAKEITAMTGDGVNDAPALKRADIGVAMGDRGTAVAKEASEMILLDDKFSTIIEAIRQGRVIFDNIQKFIHYLLSCNLSEIILIFSSILVGLPTPLLAIQILWLNLITDVFPALALAWEVEEDNVMERNPRDPNEPIINQNYKYKIILQGLVITLGPLITYWVALNSGYATQESRTIALMTLAFVQLLHVFDVRRKNGLGFDKTMFANKYLWGAIVLTIGLQFLAVYVPLLQSVLYTVAMDINMWIYVIIGSAAPVILMQLYFIIKKKFS
ncbi:MAG: cation-translocating P-type ATPase [Clostridia bacterium]